MATFELLSTLSASDLQVHDNIYEPPDPDFVQTLIPWFDFLFDDAILATQAVYYRIEVYRVSPANLVWDSQKTLFTTPILKGERSPWIQYDSSGPPATPLIEDEEYQWRVRIWDEYDHVGQWTGYVTFTPNFSPEEPFNLRTDGSVDPEDVTNAHPEFTFVPLDPNILPPPYDLHSYYQIQVSKQSDFLSEIVWDSGMEHFRDLSGVEITVDQSGSIDPPIAYGMKWTEVTPGNWQYQEDPAAEQLEEFTLYYWRVKTWDDDGHEGVWSTSVATFEMGEFIPFLMELYTNGKINPKWVPLVPTFSYKLKTYYDVVSFQIQVYDNSGYRDEPENGFNLIWDSTKTDYDEPIEVKVSGSGEIINGTPVLYWNLDTPFYTDEVPENEILESGERYYWRLKIWDAQGSESEWSHLILLRPSYFNVEIWAIFTINYIPVGLRA